MRLALAQFEVDAGRVDANRERAVEAVADAADRGADLVVLPELFTVGYFAFDAYDRAAEPVSGPTHDRLAAAARDHDVWILAGSVVEDLAATRETGAAPTPADGGLANTSVLLDPSGERRAIYRKHHLFGYDSAEADRLVPGDRVETADVGEFTVGITTCYDLRFPALYRRLVDAGATLVLVPSAWPYPRVEHWQVLPRARAVENLCYVAAANATGEVEDATLLGRSTVYDPWGTAVASAGDEPDLVVAEVTPDRVDELRSEFPALRDRRL